MLPVLLLFIIHTYSQQTINYLHCTIDHLHSTSGECNQYLRTEHLRAPCEPGVTRLTRAPGPTGARWVPELTGAQYNIY